MGFISIKQIIFFRKVAEENKRNIIEELKFFKPWGKQEFSLQTPVQESISRKKYLSRGRSANFAKFEDDKE